MDKSVLWSHMNEFWKEYCRSICMRTAHSGDKRNGWEKKQNKQVM